ncbi:glycosyltransferase family 4 protein [Curtobacterium sp. MWU13-2055]|uniref:glycosyltransferase family 4 protein n=1 Tax=Curtobacterium sp. MWU13-2055 TaxID=2931928 RepID=UPI00200DD408|nr:glycosyltransferase family 4 protein [Curtobacterium sp. MWU13-2055]
MVEPHHSKHHVGRVLYCHPGTELYGSDRMALATVQGLVDSGWDVHVVVPDDGPLRSLLEEAGATVEVRAFSVLRKNLLRPAEFVRFVGRLPLEMSRTIRRLRTTRPDVIYLNTITQPVWLAAARLVRIPAVVHVREAEDSVPVVVQTALLAPLSLASAVLANSAATAAHVRERGFRLASKTHVVYNGKDWSPYLRSEYTHPRDVATLLFVGRLSPRKGTDLAIRALSEIRASGVSARLEIVGSVFPGYEWYEQELRELVASLGLKEFVRFTGFMQDTTQAFARADVVVVPSRAEPFGTVAAEGMAAMRPTVVARVQGLVEIVTDDAVGRTFAPDDASDLAKQCLSLLRDAARATEVARAGYDSVMRRFSMDQYLAGVGARLAEVRKNAERVS